MPGVQFQIARTDWFGSRPVQNPDSLLLGGPNQVRNVSTCGPAREWLDLSVRISGSVFWVFQCMVAFRYPTVNRKISTLVRHCLPLMHWLPLQSKQQETRCPPHRENERQCSVNDFCSCILDQLRGDWLKIVIYEVLATIKGKRESCKLPALSWKSASTKHQWVMASLHG